MNLERFMISRSPLHLGQVFWIAGLYASRNEAIRAGMIMVIEAEKRRCPEK